MRGCEEVFGSDGRTQGLQVSSNLPVLPTGSFVVRFDLDAGEQKEEGEPVAVWVAALEDSAGQLGQGDT